jgi:hypothetical protein
LVHSEDDVQIPIGDMRAIAAAKPDAEVHVEANLGHRKVLYAPPVIRRVRAFLTGD